jgi:hypothetical protein
MVLPDTDMSHAFSVGTDYDQTFIQNLALFFTCFFRQHLAIAERTAQTNPTLLQSAMSLLVNISHVEDQEIFKICLEYFNGLCSDLYHTECQFQPPPQSPLVLAPVALSPAASPRLQLYAPILTKLRVLMVTRMAKPEEVLIVEDENGEIVRETMKDSDAITMYKTMRETLVYLTHLNYDDTENIMLDKLQYQVDGSQWSWHNLNTLCWAIGSISGAMSEEDEKRFLVTVIKVRGEQRVLSSMCSSQSDTCGAGLGMRGPRAGTNMSAGPPVDGRYMTITSNNHLTLPPPFRYIGPSRAVRDEARQGQQGRGGLQHHVRRRPVSALSPRSLEVPEDGGQQAV